MPVLYTLCTFPPAFPAVVPNAYALISQINVSREKGGTLLRIVKRVYWFPDKFKECPLALFIQHSPSRSTVVNLRDPACIWIKVNTVKRIFYPIL
jgi:hypothetical protein